MVATPLKTKRADRVVLHGIGWLQFEQILWRPWALVLRQRRARNLRLTRRAVRRDWCQSCVSFPSC